MPQPVIYVMGTLQNNYKVRDHDHRTGQHRGACHNGCNILHYNNKYLPVCFIISKATTHIID
jgi:hypothetical protein